MHKRLLLTFALQVILLGALALFVNMPQIPLGVVGEWTWARIPSAPQVGWLPLGLLGLTLYAGFAWRGYRGLTNPRRGVEYAWVAALAVSSILIQIAILTAAPEGYGLIKWATIRLPGSSGYLTIADREVTSIGRFWEDYPEWIRKQDALHIGTHPPGLIVGSRRRVLDRMEANPSVADKILASVLGEIDAGVRSILGHSTKRERAAIVVIGFTTLTLCELTVVPIYLLARSGLTPAESWGAATLWPVVPSAILFQPTADCAFPFLATWALVFAGWSGLRRPWFAIFAGLLLAIGMQFTLAFLPVGLIVAIVLVSSGETGWRRIGFTALGFFALTGMIWLMTRANPFVIWWINSRNHARFYEQFSRSYLMWVFVDLIELAVAIGLPIIVWTVCGLSRRRDLLVSWATLGVLLFLNFSGKNLSEVARLWLPFMPPFLIAASAGMCSVGGREKTLFTTIALVGLETLLLQTTIQVVYPV